MNATNTPASQHSRAFSLVELLLAVTILALLIGLLAESIVRTQNTMSRATTHVTEFQEARSALDSISTTLSQAVMDGYWSYRIVNNNPTAYDRASDHHFVLGQGKALLGASAEHGQAMFFQAPMGFAGSFGETAPPANMTGLKIEQLRQLINCTGFYVQFGNDLTERPTFLQTNEAKLLNPERKRFRLMQYLQPAESSCLYQAEFGLNKKNARDQAIEWFTADLAAHSRPVADNILALILIPYSVNVTAVDAAKGYTNTDTTPDLAYSYDSRAFQWGSSTDIDKSRRHQLPPKIEVILIATDDKSFDQLAQRVGSDETAAAQVRNLFAEKFIDHTKLATDLESVETELGNLKLHHKTLSTTIALRGAKWITEL